MDSNEVLMRGNRQLAFKIARLMAAMKQRSADILTQAVEGLGVSVSQADAGDQQAAQLLDALGALLEKVRARRAGITLPNGQV